MRGGSPVVVSSEWVREEETNPHPSIPCHIVACRARPLLCLFPGNALEGGGGGGGGSGGGAMASGGGQRLVSIACVSCRVKCKMQRNANTIQCKYKCKRK